MNQNLSGSMDNINLYHGTSSFFAASLLQGSHDSPLYKNGGLQCASDLYVLMLKIAGSFEETPTLFPPENPAANWAPLALRTVHNQIKFNTWAYGSFYATLNKRIAVSYAANNPLGSELLRAISATVEALRVRYSDQVSRLLIQYPNLINILEATHYPVVLELSGIPIGRLLDDRGTTIKEDKLNRYLTWVADGIRAPCTVCIEGQVAPHVTRAFRIELPGDPPPFGQISDDRVKILDLALDQL